MNLTCWKTLLRVAVAVCVLLPVTGAFAQIWPLPASTPNTDVPCTTSPTCSSFTPAPKTIGYPNVLGFAGRYADAEDTHAYQFPLRTLYTRAFKVAPERNRVYLMMGSSLAAYNIDTFMTRLAASETLKPASHIASRPFGTEYFLNWDSVYYAEADRSWVTPVGDGQDRLFDYDWDDRKLVYVAYSNFGWGILNDDGSQLTSVVQVPLETLVPLAIASVKTSSNDYYVLSSSYQSPSTTEVWNVNTPASPRKERTLANTGVVRFTKSGATRIAARFGDNSVSIYNTDTLVAGGTPIRKYTGSYGPVASDGTNFYSAVVTSSGWAISVFRPSGSDYAESRYPVTQGYNGFPINIRAGAGYLAIAGIENGAYVTYSARVYKLAADGTPTEVSFDMPFPGGSGQRSFWAMYYSYAHPPNGYIHPGYSGFEDFLPFSYNGKIYFGLATGGLGDVWLLKSGDSVSVTVNSHGTTNPSSTGGSGTFYGDPITVTGAMSSAKILPLNWDFGDGFTTTVNSGSSVTHQHGGALADLPLTRLVKATLQSDTTIFDSKNITLARPTARFGVAGEIFTAASPASKPPIVAGDVFTDASDGSKEGHTTDWNLDSGAQSATGRAPDQTVDVGPCRANATLSFRANYGPTGNIVTSDIPIFTYDVRPLAATIYMPAASTVNDQNANFTAVVRWTSNTTLLNATVLNYTWTLLDTDGVTPVPGRTKTDVQTFLPNSTGLTLEFSVPLQHLTAGRKVQLVVSADITSGTPPNPCAAANLKTQTLTTAAFTVPDPKLTKTPLATGGCDYAGSPCRFTASSISGASTADWSYKWLLDGNVVQGPGTQTVYDLPTAMTSAQHSVSVQVTNGITPQTVTDTFTLLPPLCATPWTAANTAINKSVTCGTSGNQCAPGTAITFNVSGYGWAPAGCENYLWNFGDGTGQSTEATPTHTFSSSGTFTVSLTISGASSTNPLTVQSNSLTFGTVAPPPTPPPTPPPSTGCSTMSASSGYVGIYGSQTSCTTYAGTCSTTESVTLTLYTNGYNFDCSSVTYNWSFGDGTNGAGRQVTHTYSAAGNYTAAVTVSNSAGTFTFSDIVRVGSGSTGGTGSCPTMVAENNVYITFSGAQCTTSSTTTCTVAETLQFAPGTFGSYPYDSCAAHTYLWNFGDGGTATTKSATHAYAAGGTYPVSFTVTRSGQSPVTAHATVKVGITTPITADFTATGLGMTITFTPTVSPANAGTSFEWTFGDGGTSTETSAKTVSRKYETPATYTVSLKVNGTTTVTRQIAVPIRTRAVRR